MKLSDFSIKRPVFTIVTMFLVIILGAVSFFRIPMTLIPELNPPVAVVVSSYPGASPIEVNEKITKPLESSLSTTPGLKTMQTSSQEGANFVLLMFDWSTKIDDIQMDVMQRIEQVPVPDGASAPRFMKFDPAQFPVIQLSLRAESDEADILKLSEELEQELRRTEGVASVTISGEVVEEIQVDLNQKKLEENGLAQEDIVQVIQASHVSMPGESIETDDKQLTTRVVSMLTSVDDIKEIPIMTNPITGKKVKVRDVGKVSLTEAKASTITRANEEPAVLMSVLQESGANTAEVSKEFKKSLDDLLETDAFKNVKADILFDQGDYIQLAVGNIGQSLILGGLFAMIVLFIFLRGIKSPIIIGVAIPYSVIVTFVMMFFSNFTLNIMTLGALALGIGMLVDNAIVVIENIERHLAMGKTPKEAASDGTKEIGGAIIASTLTTLAVFVPVIFITGIIGEIFTEFALTISFSLFASLVVALTVVPMMASRMLKEPKVDMASRRRRSKPLNRFTRSVRWALRNRILVLTTTILLLILSGFGLYKVGTEFLPATDEGFVSVSVQLPNGSSPAATEAVIDKIEKQLRKEDDVEVYVSLIGGTQESLAQGASDAERGEIYVKLLPLSDRERSIFTFIDETQPKVIKAVDNEEVEISFNLQTASGSAPNTLSFSLKDTNEERLTKAVEDVTKELEQLETVQKVTNTVQDTVEEIEIEIDRKKADELGLLPYQIAESLTNITRGQMATQIIGEEDHVIEVLVQYEEKARNSLNRLKKVKLRTQNGDYVELQEVAKIGISDSPVSIQRVDQAHAISFDVQYVSSESLGEMTTEVNELIEGLELPKEIEMSYGGDRELFESAINDMMLALALAVVLVYIVMAAQFESFKYPLVIMISVPLMIIGVSLSSFITNTPISVTTIIGILVLVGIVVNNGIVLVDYINQQKAKGTSSFDAILIATRDRVRPILMTALTTILGLLPLALGLGEGTEMNQPMGIAVIGGLISSTFLTLYIVPVIYSLFDKETRRRRIKTVTIEDRF